MIYIWHYMIGLVAAGLGWWTRGFCRHNWHRAVLTFASVGAETIIAVKLVG